jgi:DNA-binding IclR family transcriptional regulator
MKKDNEPGSSGEVQSIRKVFRLMEVLSQEDEMSVTELSNVIVLNKATTFRLLNTLKTLGYIEQNPVNEKYRMNLKLFQIGSNVVSRIDEIREARPVIERLGDATGENVYLAVRSDEYVVYLDKIDSKHIIRLFCNVGDRAPSWCTGVGKALLAWLPEREINAIFKGKKLVRHTPNTITQLKDLQTELKKTAARGYAIDNQERWPGLFCVAVPIFNKSRHVVAAISISWPEMRHSEECMARYRDLVIAAGKEISRRLGCPM